MNTPTRITIVRHGETLWNRELRLQGSQDIPLSDIGLTQAEAVAKRFEHEPYHRVYSSHLSRAHQTAEKIAGTLQIPHHVHEQLMERSYGTLEGKTREEILAIYPDFWGVNSVQTLAPGVESIEALRERAFSALSEIADRHAGENLLIVSHGGTINAFLHKITDGASGTGINRLGNTSVTEVLREHDGTWRVVQIGCTAHIPEDSE